LKKILITGGSGFLGFALANKLRKKYKIIIFDNNFRGSFDKFQLNQKSNVTLVKGDIRNEKQVLNVSKGCDIIYHLAFINGTSHFYDRPKLVMDVGIQGTINILKSCLVNKKIKKFYFASSSEVYFKPKFYPTKENEYLIVPDPKNPRFSYSGSKIIGEILSFNYLRESKIKFNIFRPHNVFGPNMGFEHVIPEIIKKIFIKTNKFRKKVCTIKIQGTGNETRSFCFVEDAVNQLEIIQTKGKNFEIYNIGQTKEISVKKLIQDISKILKIKVILQTTGLREGSVNRRCPNILKIKKIGYKSKNNYQKGLTKTVNWYKNFYEKKL